MFPYFGLLLIVLMTPSTLWSQPLNAKWSGGEHLQLGLEGSQAACLSFGISQKDCPDRRIFREDKKYVFRYGEILTSADYYNSPSEFYLDKKSHIVKAVRCAHKFMNHHAKPIDSRGDYEGCNATGIFGLPGYLEAVAQNYSHFGWNNMVAYVEYHSKALQFAKQSYENKLSNPRHSRQLLNKALIYNAYADHYLTDAFASGHIRVPRTQIKEWAKNHLPGTLRSTRGDLLTMFLHNFESTNPRTKQEEGLRVQNSRGDVWYTRGDKNLYSSNVENDPAALLPKMAVLESFRDILAAAEYGDPPEGVFQATLLVPFQKDIPLAEKLSPEHQKVSHRAEVTWLFFSSIPMAERFIFFKTDFTRMLDNMANIFVKFRRDVVRDQIENSELKKRLPEKYLESYANVE